MWVLSFHRQHVPAGIVARGRIVAGQRSQPRLRPAALRRHRVHNMHGRPMALQLPPLRLVRLVRACHVHGSVPRASRHYHFLPTQVAGQSAQSAHISEVTSMHVSVAGFSRPRVPIPLEGRSAPSVRNSEVVSMHVKVAHSSCPRWCKRPSPRARKPRRAGPPGDALAGHSPATAPGGPAQRVHHDTAAADDVSRPGGSSSMGGAGRGAHWQRKHTDEAN